MKKFVFYISSEKSHKTLPNTIRTMSVYQLKKNSLIPCGYVEYDSGSYKGNETEIMNYLSKNKFIQKEFSEGYYKYDNGKFTIEQI